MPKDLHISANDKHTMQNRAVCGLAGLPLLVFSCAEIWFICLNTLTYFHCSCWTAWGTFSVVMKPVSRQISPSPSLWHWWRFDFFCVLFFFFAILHGAAQFSGRTQSQFQRGMKAAYKQPKSISYKASVHLDEIKPKDVWQLKQLFYINEINKITLTIFFFYKK